jgi:hypothetical protein
MRDNCLNCSERKLGCHDGCSIYAGMKQEKAEINKKRRQFMDGLGHDGCLAAKCGRVKRYDQARFKY